MDWHVLISKQVQKQLSKCTWKMYYVNYWASIGSIYSMHVLYSLVITLRVAIEFL